MVSEVKDSSFQEEVLNSKEPVLIDFWAEWCGPCRMLAPILAELANDMGSKVKIMKMNIDQNPQTPSNLGVRSIPTMMLFKSGVLLGTKVGLAEKASLKEWIESLI